MNTNKISKIFTSILIISFCLFKPIVSNANQAEFIQPNITTSQLDQARLNAVGSTLQEIIEQTSGIPVSAVSTMTGNFSTETTEGLVDGLIGLANLGTDIFIGTIKGVGVYYFVAKMEKHLLNLAKSYLDEYMVDQTWKVFKNLLPNEKTAWLNGEIVGVMVGSVGTYYTDRNVADLRLVFKRYEDDLKVYNEYLSSLDIIKEELFMATQAKAITLISPASDNITVDIDKKILIDPEYNNTFFYSLKILDGSSEKYNYFDTMEVDDDHSDGTSYSNLGEHSFMFSKFTDVDWNGLAQKYPDGIPVELEITAAVRDSSQILSKLNSGVNSNTYGRYHILRNVPGMSSDYLHKKTLRYNVTLVNFLEAPVYSKNINGTRVDLSWTAVDDATSYTLYAAVMPFTSTSQIYTLEMGAKLNVSFDLAPGSHYISAVKAFNDDTSSTYSNIIYVKIEETELSSIDISGVWNLTGVYDISMSLTTDGQTQTQQLPSQSAPSQSVTIVQNGSDVEFIFNQGENLKGTIDAQGGLILKGKAIDESILEDGLQVNIQADEQVFTGQYNGQVIQTSGSVKIDMDFQSQGGSSTGFILMKLNMTLTR